MHDCDCPGDCLIGILTMLKNRKTFESANVRYGGPHKLKFYRYLENLGEDYEHANFRLSNHVKSCEECKEVYWDEIDKVANETWNQKLLKNSNSEYIEYRKFEITNEYKRKIDSSSLYLNKCEFDDQC